MNYMCDFETTNEIENCRVWAAGIYAIELDHFIYFNNIDKYMNWLFFNAQKGDSFYFHNLAFDGDFILNWLLKNKFTYEEIPKYLKHRQFTTLISNKGQFYTITICIMRGSEKLRINIKNSLCLLPFAVSKLSKSFGISELKGSINYNAKRDINHELTSQEVEYLKNDCVIVGKALKKAWELELHKLTIGSNAINIFTHIIGGKKQFRYIYPVPSYDTDIRPSYKGGWTYANPKFTGKIIGKGIVLDVNSLYPYVLYDKMLPYGDPIFKEGEPVENAEFPLYVVSMWCSFEIKKDHLPTIQLKGTNIFKPNEYITTTNGDIVNLCLTNIDLALFFDHYNVDDITYCGTYYFKATDTIFKNYINKFMDLKIRSEKENNDAMRTLAKLLLNNLYGKFATNPRTQQKIPYLDEEEKTAYYNSNYEYIEPVYIPVGIFTTSYAREHTIRAAQANYDRFLYADTDSLHLKGLEIPENLKVDQYELGAWKHELTFKKAKYIRAKTYIELSVDDKLKVTCCGMPDSCHKYVTFDNFNIGMEYKGKLQRKKVAGGTILYETTFKIRG